MKPGEDLGLFLHDGNTTQGGVFYYVLSSFTSVLLKSILNINSNLSMEVKYACDEMHNLCIQRPMHLYK